jgi:hypothetical protein
VTTLDAWLEAQRINGGPHGFECVGREALSRMWAAAAERVPMPGARWYSLNRNGLATLCANEADAKSEAARQDRTWPQGVPHRAVQLVEASQLVGEQERLRVFARWAMEALLALETIEPDDYEDGGEHLRMLMDRGRRLVDAVVLKEM